MKTQTSKNMRHHCEIFSASSQNNHSQNKFDTRPQRTTPTRNVCRLSRTITAFCWRCWPERTSVCRLELTKRKGGVLKPATKRCGSSSEGIS
ncbi:unnamed protein product [Nippostrongylus brasiliensis]|uniref:Uncharacterized protein n=1 Tax=Nippostrongylus brasiliensis TaxID=27835 RepID=A0A0N4YPG8_NIPBR|nr:unnamed protein product [Nippostrongylus brasiliensis]